MKNSKIPAIEKVLQQPNVSNLVVSYGREIVVKTVREIFDDYRNNKIETDFNNLDAIILQRIKYTYSSTLKKVINATGIILHTNLGRAPLGKKIVAEIEKISTGYSNLEFDLNKGKRGNRNNHIKNLIKKITNSEDAVVVNNNAAAVMLTLQTFAKGKEVIISRGELIEIGGSFRIPDIMKTSGAKMVEVGTTNRTKLSDYENAITENTAIIFKAHKSNYFIGGFTEEVSIKKLSELAHKNNLIMYFDLGSGLLRKPERLPVEDEPDVTNSVLSGADIVSFSGDKLLGGPQAGIIIGKHKYISKIEKHPMMRALRVGKLTLSALSAVIKSYMSDEMLIKNLPIFQFLSRNDKYLRNLAEELKFVLDKHNMKSKIVKNIARCGGGTLPNLKIDSYAVKLLLDKKIKASGLYMKLLECDIPIISVLKRGELFFDVFTLRKDDFNIIAKNLSEAIENYK